MFAGVRSGARTGRQHARAAAAKRRKAVFAGIRGGQEWANPAFMVLLAGVCIVWVLLLGVPAIGSVFGLPAMPAAWALAAALPAGWAVWCLARRRRWAPRLFIER
ncbi:hypothetical protein [Variovorax sp. SRS16]|uniref:hypothetical protein n=1 Tax=Variovorax sp. SRS16 TaxID=282217 RepID=UPI003FCEBB96